MSVLRLRLTPLVRVEKWTAGWIVTVRPCTDYIASMRHFDTEAGAAEYAATLQREHGLRFGRSATRATCRELRHE